MPDIFSAKYWQMSRGECTGKGDMTTTKPRAARLNMWRDIVSVVAEPELGDVAAGRDAELALRSMATTHLTWKTASIFHSKRVPQNTQASSQRYEIDLIVVSQKQISAIEIKNWSGRLHLNVDEWIQEKTDRRMISHVNPLVKNREKLRCLCRLLESRGIALPKTTESKVIFWNNKLAVPPFLAQRDDIVMRHQLERFLGKQKATGFGERFLQSVLELCLDEEESKVAADVFFKAISIRDYNAAVRAISELETFDKLELFGGRTLVGDLRELRTEERTIPLKKLTSGTEVSVERWQHKVALFLSALLTSSPLLSLTGPLRNVQIGPKDRILFHQAGEKKPQEFELGRVLKLVRG